MGNRSRILLRTTLLPCLAPLYLAFLLYHLTSTVAGGSPSPYTPVDNIVLNCGSSTNSTALDGRTWIGDEHSKFFPVEQSQNQASLTAIAVQQSSSNDKVPYANARLFLSEFTYTFPVTAGQKFIRLYFYPASYLSFDRSNALFSVKTGRFTLLSDFNASLTADAEGDSGDTIFREYCVNIEKDQRLNITFTPSGSKAYALINGIEILSMPANLYYTPSDDKGFSFIGQQNPYDINNSTALETVYRLNVGGGSISPSEDTGMFRSWSQDDPYFRASEVSFVTVNRTIELKFTQVRAYTAPEDVYKTARTMGNDSTINKRYNLTWEFPVDSGFDYLVRLHFCEHLSGFTQEHQRVFLIFIQNQTAEIGADVIRWSGGNGVPVYKNYAVTILSKEGEKKVNISIALQANPVGSKSLYSDAILNGVEVFKVSDFTGSLAGPNPDPLPSAPPTVVPPTTPTKPKNNRRAIVSVVGGGVSGLVVLSILGFLIFRYRRRVKDSGFSDGTNWWGPVSFSTTKSTKTHRSSLPSALCRNFSLAEIRAATNNFDDVFIIGVGGFGDVYKGYIDGGANPVAIKRLKPGSQQGANEFETEIEMLSQLRHIHLVSLIGYCNDSDEMILVYDYMANGTLRDHLYNTHNSPLSWKQRLEICIGAARGLNYLHRGAKQTIIHRDVKTTNILLDENWVAKVSDFGLSKVGPSRMSKSHVSTVVKGSFGYLDPEYYKRQQLTEKCDVYSFGVVLCEVLCARPPIIRTTETAVGLARWARESCGSGKVEEIIDPSIKGEMGIRCLKKFVEVAMNCLLDNGIERPSMDDVLGGLEFALQLQESADEDVGLNAVEIEELDDEKGLFPKSTLYDCDDMSSSSGGQVSSTNSNSRVTLMTSGEQSSTSTSRDSGKLMSSGTIFSEIMNSSGL
ncbi:receptor-like protein kinase FERONIA [Corylus avellana]|uniref:receptor-like protein kinase FERONIA n=1 Tax=Corylus avellana TaxID=13451 RepID=UPI00286B6359|nr:receptor-like protein kinase FERONIA [Corylus avellana]